MLGTYVVASKDVAVVDEGDQAPSVLAGEHLLQLIDVVGADEVGRVVRELEVPVGKLAAAPARVLEPEHPEVVVGPDVRLRDLEDLGERSR